jgi:hypothetical protein
LRNSWNNVSTSITTTTTTTNATALQAQHSAYSSGASNHVNDDDEIEEDEGKQENSFSDVDLNVSESLPPEQYREPAVDKNQKMKLQLEVCFFVFVLLFGIGMFNLFLFCI